MSVFQKFLTVPLFIILLFQFKIMADPTADAQMQQALHAPTYEADLFPHDTKPEEVVAGQYGVFLFPGHSLEQHSEFIKTDLTPHIMHIFSFDKNRVIYSARDVNDLLLAAIRSDPGVEYVEYDYKVELIE
jgi:hypothetical protein